MGPDPDSPDYNLRSRMLQAAVIQVPMYVRKGFEDSHKNGSFRFSSRLESIYQTNPEIYPYMYRCPTSDRPSEVDKAPVSCLSALPLMQVDHDLLYMISGKELRLSRSDRRRIHPESRMHALLYLPVLHKRMDRHVLLHERKVWYHFVFHL